jgi:hypothetical protein
MKPWMKPSFNRYDDDDSESDLESDFEYPKLLLDYEGRKKFILNKTEERKFQQRVLSLRAHTTGDNTSVEDLPKKNSTGVECKKPNIENRKANTELESSKPSAKKKGRTHGLAPFGMTVPLNGKAYMTEKGSKGKRPLMESGFEIYNRIQIVKSQKMAKDNKRYIQRLKKTGKVGTLAPYMFDI